MTVCVDQRSQVLDLCFCYATLTTHGLGHPNEKVTLLIEGSKYKNFY